MLAPGYASIAICDRCCFKFSYMSLRADGNTPGLRVCQDCWDPKDPWRLPPIQPDAIALKYPRPDTPLTFDIISSVPIVQNAYVGPDGISDYVGPNGIDVYVLGT